VVALVRHIPRVLRELLETDGLCMHWWVSETPVVSRDIHARDEYRTAGAA